MPEFASVIDCEPLLPTAKVSTLCVASTTAVAPESVPITFAPEATGPAPCTDVDNAPPVEAEAAVALVNPRAVPNAVVVTVTAELELLPLLLITSWLPLSDAVAPDEWAAK